MRRNYRRVIGIVGMMALSLSLNVAAASKPAYNYRLSNTGQNYTVDGGTYNLKTYPNNMWTLSVTSIKTGSQSPYGIHFIPFAGWSTPCTGSGVWRKTGQTASVTGRVYTPYASGFRTTGGRYLGARIDDSYYPSVWSSTGWWNADEVYQ